MAEGTISFSDMQSKLGEQEQSATNQTEQVVTETTTTATETVVDTNAEPNNQTQGADEIVSHSDFSLDFGQGDSSNSTQNTETQTQIDPDEFIKKIGREELLKKLGVSEFALEMDTHLKNGGKADDYILAKSINYDSIGDEEIVKADLRNKFPKWDAQKIDKYFNSKYGFDENTDPELAQQRSIELEADAYKLREIRKNEQSKFKIADPQPQISDEDYLQYKAQQENNAQLIQKVSELYKTHPFTKSLYENKRVEISLGDGVKPFVFNVNKPEVLTEMLTDGGKIYSKLTSTESGEPDMYKQYLGGLFMADPQKFIMSIFNYGQSMGLRSKLVGEGQNAQKPQAKVASMTSNDGQTVRQGTFGNLGSGG